MRTDDDRTRTIGRQAARLISSLTDGGKPIFSVEDAAGVSGLAHASARSFLAKLVERGVVTRLKPGLFGLIPYGYAPDYFDPYVAVAGLVGAADYYLSHASALEIHQMTTQPQLVVYATTTRQVRHRTVHGTEFRFVELAPTRFFGRTKHWIVTQPIYVSDIEKTIIDCLLQPQHCGGVAEIAKGLWMQRAKVRHDVLLDYAERIMSGAVVRRLGYFMELYGLATQSDLERLRAGLSDTYALLDPTLPAQGSYLSRWRLRLNVEPQELQEAIST